jgi:hypothetical protein
MTHPGACPFCGSETVSYVQPDNLLRHARLRETYGLAFYVIGDSVDSVDFDGPNLFFCYGCESEYPVPEGLLEEFDGRLKVDYPRSPGRGEPGHLGHVVTWAALPHPFNADTVRAALATVEEHGFGVDVDADAVIEEAVQLLVASIRTNRKSRHMFEEDA